MLAHSGSPAACLCLSFLTRPASFILSRERLIRRAEGRPRRSPYITACSPREDTSGICSDFVKGHLQESEGRIVFLRMDIKV